MSIKRILIPLPGEINRSAEIDLGLSAAKLLGAQVEALFISEPPPIHGVGDGVYYGRQAAAAAAVPLNYAAEERTRHALAAREHFTHACESAGIPMLEPGAHIGALPVASWHESEGSYADVAAGRAAAFDLTVAASAVVVESLMSIAERSLLHARRPVMLAPSRLDTELSDAGMIGWDESPECWHAVTAALPLLKHAKQVHVVSVDKKSRASERADSQAEVLAYLRCHGVTAEARVVAPDLRSVGDTLLAVASELNAGLMVMGAYSHTRLREMLLGGATRHILRNATARPVLMAH